MAILCPHVGFPFLNMLIYYNEHIMRLGLSLGEGSYHIGLSRSLLVLSHKPAGGGPPSF